MKHNYTPSQFLPKFTSSLFVLFLFTSLNVRSQSYCTPILGVSSSADIAINNVKLTNSNNVMLIDNSSANNTQGYDDYTKIIGTELKYGDTYTITIGRNTNISPMSRSIWVDWNIDGDFDDEGELVASETIAKTSSFTASFKVPDRTAAAEGKTRIRIGTSYSNDPNNPCGASGAVKNANRFGEFEDYGITMGKVTGGVNVLEKDLFVNVYPNPSTGIINISYDLVSSEHMEVQVYNVSGTLLTEIKITPGQSGIQTIDLSNEANGLYIVRTIVNGRQVTRKVLVRKR